MFTRTDPLAVKIYSAANVCNIAKQHVFGGMHGTAVVPDRSAITFARLSNSA